MCKKIKSFDLHIKNTFCCGHTLYEANYAIFVDYKQLIYKY